MKIQGKKISLEYNKI